MLTNILTAGVATGALMLLGACSITTPAASPSPVVVQERAPPTVVTPGSSVIVQPRY